MSERRLSTIRTWLASMLVAAIAGFGTDILAGAFRLTLDAGGSLRTGLILTLHDWPFVGSALFILLAAMATVTAAWLVVRFASTAAGSGIPRVQSVLDGDLPPAPPAVMPVKFVAASLAITSGLALGREGPSVQMGASLSQYVSKFLNQTSRDRRLMMAAGGAAGLAAAFSAPLAGVLFGIEVLSRKFEPRLVLMMLAASLSATVAVDLLVGTAIDFPVHTAMALTSQQWVALAIAGVVIGLGSVVYNIGVFAGAVRSAAVFRMDYRLRAAAIGATFGLVGWNFPWLVGGGDDLALAALHGTAGGVLLVILLIFARFAMIILSVSAGVPGGLLAPLLSLGAQLGLSIGLIFLALVPDAHSDATLFALVGMAGLFAGTIRAPLTAVLLTVEVTGASQFLGPLLLACMIATAVASACGSEPLLDALRLAHKTSDERRAKSPNEPSTEV